MRTWQVETAGASAWLRALRDNMNVNQSYISDELTHFVGRAKPDNERYALLLRILGHRYDARTPREGWLQASHREEFGPAS